MNKWLYNHRVEIVLGLLLILIMVLVAVFSIGLDCLLNGVNCPPVTNMTAQDLVI